MECGQRTEGYIGLPMGSGTPSAFGSSPCKEVRGIRVRHVWALSIYGNRP